MTLFVPRIVAPDSSHWAKWLDATRSPDPGRRRRARGPHARMLERGRVPLLSWHHLEELLGIRDDATASARIDALQALPLLAWIRLPHGNAGLGSIVHVLAAEAVAACEGCNDLVSVRDRARSLLVQVGGGTQAMGKHTWVWDGIRPLLRSRWDTRDMIAAYEPLDVFDENRTVAEIAKGDMVPAAEVGCRLERIRAVAFQAASRATGDRVKAREMAAAFVESIRPMLPLTSPHEVVRSRF